MVELPLTNPTQAKRVWEGMSQPSTRRVAMKMRQSGRPVSHQTVNRWRNQGWRPLECEQHHPLDDARELLDDAMPLLTGDPMSTANVDIAPTVARILQFSMPAAQGRVLEEALHEGPPITEYAVVNKTHRSSTKTGLSVKQPTDVDGRAINPNMTTYSVDLKTKIVTRNGASYTYFDQARAIRE
jgi:hypothetical protein